MNKKEIDKYIDDFCDLMLLEIQNTTKKKVIKKSK